MLNETAALAEYVHAALVAVVYLIAAYGGIAVGSDPDSRKVVRVYLVVDELSKAGLVHVDAAGLTVVYLAVHDGGVGTGFHLEPGDSVVVDIVRLEVTLVRGFFDVDLFQITVVQI